jgi:branched-chain amino acid transport system ATP-binding protein
MLSVRDLSIRYGRGTVVTGVNLEVREGTVVSLVGTNGAGKTSLINAVSGLVRPAQGRITLLGRDLDGVPAFRRARQGIVQVPEGRDLFPKMSVRENLLMGGAHLPGPADVARALEEVVALFPRLGERARQPAGSLSGGEQQMLAIARGLMMRPRLFMLDEPSLGLAPIIVKEIFGVIRRLNSQGMTILLVEQNVRMSLRVCDYAYVIERGRIVAEGPGAALLEDEATKMAYFGLS